MTARDKDDITVKHTQKLLKIVCVTGRDKMGCDDTRKRGLNFSNGFYLTTLNASVI